MRAQLLSCVQLFVTQWTVACQAPLSMGFPQQGSWSGLPFTCPRDLPIPGIFPTQGLNLCLLHWQTDSLPLNHQGSPFDIIRTGIYSSLNCWSACVMMSARVSLASWNLDKIGLNPLVPCPEKTHPSTGWLLITKVKQRGCEWAFIFLD